MALKDYTGDYSELESIAENYSHDIRLDYSGRGMYGESCFAIVGNLHDLIDFTVDLAQYVGGDYGSGDVDSYLGDFLDQIASVRQDSMGMDTVFYWPAAKTKQN